MIMERQASLIAAETFEMIPPVLTRGIFLCTNSLSNTAWTALSPIHPAEQSDLHEVRRDPLQTMTIYALNVYLLVMTAIIADATSRLTGENYEEIPCSCGYAVIFADGRLSLPGLCLLRGGQLRPLLESVSVDQSGAGREPGCGRRPGRPGRQRDEAPGPARGDAMVSGPLLPCQSAAIDVCQ